MKNSKLKVSFFALSIGALITFSSCSKEEQLSKPAELALKDITYNDDVKCTVETEIPGQGTVTEKGTRCFQSNAQNCSFVTNCQTTATFVDLVNHYYTNDQWQQDLANGVPYSEPEIIEYIDNNFRVD